MLEKARADAEPQTADTGRLPPVLAALRAFCGLLTFRNRSWRTEFQNLRISEFGPPSLFGYRISLWIVHDIARKFFADTAGLEIRRLMCSGQTILQFSIVFYFALACIESPENEIIKRLPPAFLL